MQTKYSIAARWYEAATWKSKNSLYSLDMPEEIYNVLKIMEEGIFHRTCLDYDAGLKSCLGAWFGMTVQNETKHI